MRIMTEDNLATDIGGEKVWEKAIAHHGEKEKKKKNRNKKWCRLSRSREMGPVTKSVKVLPIELKVGDSVVDSLS